MPRELGGVCEIVFRNEDTFDYMVDNDLWYLDGAVEQLYGANPITIGFPVPSIEVKANYERVVSCPAGFHCNVDSAGNTVALVSFHLITKELPNWFWSTGRSGWTASA